MSPRGMALSAATRSDDVEVLTYLTVGAQQRWATLQHNKVCRLITIGQSPSSCLLFSATIAVACLWRTHQDSAEDHAPHWSHGISSAKSAQGVLLEEGEGSAEHVGGPGSQ